MHRVSMRSQVHQCCKWFTGKYGPELDSIVDAYFSTMAQKSLKYDNWQQLQVSTDHYLLTHHTNCLDTSSMYSCQSLLQYMHNEDGLSAKGSPSFGGVEDFSLGRSNESREDFRPSHVSMIVHGIFLYPAHHGRRCSSTDEAALFQI